MRLMFASRSSGEHGVRAQWGEEETHDPPVHYKGCVDPYFLTTLTLEPRWRQAAVPSFPVAIQVSGG